MRRVAEAVRRPSGWCMTGRHQTCAERVADPVMKPDSCVCECHLRVHGYPCINVLSASNPERTPS